MHLRRAAVPSHTARFTLPLCALTYTHRLACKTKWLLDTETSHNTCYIGKCMHPCVSAVQLRLQANCGREQAGHHDTLLTVTAPWSSIHVLVQHNLKARLVVTAVMLLWYLQIQLQFTN